MKSDLFTYKNTTTVNSTVQINFSGPVCVSEPSALYVRLD